MPASIHEVSNLNVQIDANIIKQQHWLMNGNIKNT